GDRRRRDARGRAASRRGGRGARAHRDHAGSRRGGLAAELTRSEFWLGVSARPPAAARPGSARTPGNNCRAWHMLCSDAPSVRRVRGGGRWGGLEGGVWGGVWEGGEEEAGHVAA